MVTSNFSLKREQEFVLATLSMCSFSATWIQIFDSEQCSNARSQIRLVSTQVIGDYLFGAGLSAGFVLDVLYKAGFRAKENLVTFRIILICKL